MPKRFPIISRLRHWKNSNYRYWINIGDSERRLGKAEAAKAAYRKGLALTSAHLAINSSSYLVRAYMAYIQARLGQKDNAKSGILQAMQSPDENQQLLLYAILTYEALGDRGQALKLVGHLNPQMKITLEHHPDLADLCKDLRYVQMIGTSQVREEGLMALSMPVANGRETPLATIDQEIILDYDPKTYAVMVNTSQVNKGETIWFRGARGKVRIVFVSPFGEDLIGNGRFCAAYSHRRWALPLSVLLHSLRRKRDRGRNWRNP